jgi:hypothetical protein
MEAEAKPEATTIGGAKAGAPRLLDRVRMAVRLRHYSFRTEECYVAWIRRFILFHNKPALSGKVFRIGGAKVG